MLSQGLIKCEFVIDRQFDGFILQKQAALEGTQIFFATSGLTHFGLLYGFSEVNHHL